MKSMPQNLHCNPVGIATYFKGLSDFQHTRSGHALRMTQRGNRAFRVARPVRSSRRETLNACRSTAAGYSDTQADPSHLIPRGTVSGGSNVPSLLPRTIEMVRDA